MPQKAKIKAISPDHKKLEELCEEIKRVAQKTGINISGPIPLPTKEMEVNTMKSPCGDGSRTFESWKMRVHKRLIEIESDERTLRQIMRTEVPSEVKIEIELKEE